MNANQVDAVLAAAVEGVDFDGLQVEVAGGADEAAGKRRFDFTVPEQSYTGLGEAEVREVVRRHSEYVTEWYYWHAETPQYDHRWAFLRWVEEASASSVPERREALREGVTRTWGQLALTAQLVESGRRAYQVRHVDDQGATVSGLTVHTDAAAVRDISRHDEQERFRPLSTAPTLPSGWVFVDLDPGAFLDVVESFYPATVANWHLEREGDLDVTHWRETAERQTGIYDVVDELSGDQVDALADACCVDSQCLKRREWDETADRELGVPRGDGAFPCREPCSLVLAAAREFVLAEREPTETHELQLSPGERDQLDGILDAVAEGRTGEVREGDFSDPANRYRVRYLRARRFGDRDGENGTED